MQDRWMERLSEYLDGEMDRAERVSLETHLGECGECSAALEGLSRVRARARELRQAPAPPALWPRIEAAIAQGQDATAVAGPTSAAEPRAAAVAAGPARVIRLGSMRGGRHSFSLPELLAACLAVAIVSGGLVYALLRHQASTVVPGPVTVARAPETQPSPSAAGTGPLSGPGIDGGRGIAPASATIEPAVRTGAGAVYAARAEETPHEEAISELRKVLARQRDQLDPATIRTLESNLAIIDLAIDQARRALAADSANTYVKEHLAETMRRKVELLQRATMLASTSEETR